MPPRKRQATDAMAARLSAAAADSGSGGGAAAAAPPPGQEAVMAQIMAMAASQQAGYGWQVSGCG